MIDVDNLTLSMAREIYSKNLYKIESYIEDPLNKLLDTQQSGDDLQKRSEKKKIVTALENYRFEYIRHIEDTILACFHYDHINENKIKSAIDYVNEIRRDIKGISTENILIFGDNRGINQAAVYFMMFYNLSKKGTSDILDLSFFLYRTYKKTQLDFSKKSMLELCDIWEACINEYVFFTKKFKVIYIQNKQNIEKFFAEEIPYTQKYEATDFQIKQIMKYIDEGKILSLIEKISYQVNVLNLVVNKMKLKYNFLKEYYFNKITRYREIERQFINTCSSDVPDFDMLKKSFRIITYHIELRHDELNEGSFADFGSDQIKLGFLFQMIIKSYEILYSCLFKVCSTVKQRDFSLKYGLDAGVVKIYYNGRPFEKSFGEARDYFKEKLYGQKLQLDR